MKKLLLISIINIQQCFGMSADLKIALDKVTLPTSNVLSLNSLRSIFKKERSNLTPQQILDYMIHKDGLIVVKFSAAWCRPCRNFAPIVAAVAAEHQSVQVGEKKVAVFYIDVDIDEHKNLLGHYNISSIPTVLFYCKGKMLTRENSLTKNQLINTIKHLATKCN